MVEAETGEESKSGGRGKAAPSSDGFGGGEPPPRRPARRESRKRARTRGAFVPFFRRRGFALPLRELEALTRLRLTVLLPLDDARVAGEEAGVLDDRAERGFEAG